MPEQPLHSSRLWQAGGQWSHSFWKRAFLGYAIFELLLIVLSYWVTRLQCRVCVLPAVYYLLLWLQQLLLNGLLWYVLNRYYNLNRLETVLLNLFVFAVWYFLHIAMRYGMFHSGQEWLIGPKPSIQDMKGFIYGSWSDIGKYVFILIAFYMLKFYAEYSRAGRQRIQLAVMNKDMQLNLLKQQLSPHFYFNTLNNLYGLARNNSARLQPALQQLYNIMQYVINGCNEPRVLLRQEIDFLQSYTALEKLRYEQETVIEMTVTGDPGQLTIVPLLLIQFVENAFKHGMKEKSEGNWMRIRLYVNGRELEFTVENSYNEQERQGGIGLESVRRLLQLQYEDRHTLHIEQQPGIFTAHLKIQLL
jgi:sensor histidine kinase YesM